MLGVIFLLGLAEPFLYVFLIPVLGPVTTWVNWAAWVKRFRDVGLSFWWFLLVFAPFGRLTLFVMAICAERKSTRFN